MTNAAPTTLSQMVSEMLDGPPIRERLGLESGDLDAAAQMARNDLLAERGDVALTRFAWLVLIDPGNVDYQIGLAEAALATGQAEMAMQSAAAVIGERPQSPAGYFLSGRAALLMGERDLAAEDLADAARLAEAAGDRALQASALQMAALAAKR